MPPQLRYPRYRLGALENVEVPISVRQNCLAEMGFFYLFECIRYFITSLTDIHRFADAVRKHWSIGSQLHWQLDVSFGEDDAGTRKDHSPLNLNILRKQALSLLNQADLDKRVSVHRKMSRAAMDNEVLQSVAFHEK